jgi:beta-phosphoglucomutase-like phosphatase (HAD superfamily)
MLDEDEPVSQLEEVDLELEDQLDETKSESESLFMKCQELQKLEPYLARAKALIFDCDGTLLDTMPTYYKSWSRTCEEVGLQFPISRFYAYAGMSVPQIFDILIQEQLPSETNTITATYCEGRKKYHHAQIVKESSEGSSSDYDGKNDKEGRMNPPIEIVFEIIKKYHNKIPIGIASSGWKDHIIHGLEKYNVLHYFDTIVTVDDEEVEKGKPHPDMYVVAAKRLGVDVEHCVGFEDADLGMQSIVNAGYMYACDVRLFHDYPRNIEKREEEQERKRGEGEVDDAKVVEEGIKAESVIVDVDDGNHNYDINITNNIDLVDEKEVKLEQKESNAEDWDIESDASKQENTICLEGEGEGEDDEDPFKEEEVVLTDLKHEDEEESEDDEVNETKDHGAASDVTKQENTICLEGEREEEEDEDTSDITNDINPVDARGEEATTATTVGNSSSGDTGLKSAPSNDDDTFEKARELATQAMHRDREDFFTEELPLSEKQVLQSILLAEDAAINGKTDFTTKDKIHYLEKVHVASLDDEDTYDINTVPTRPGTTGAIGKWAMNLFNGIKERRSRAGNVNNNSAHSGSGSVATL